VPKKQFTPVPSSLEDIAYIAGLFDGEGWITINHNKINGWSHYQLMVGINMTDPRALRMVAARFGGFFKLQERKKETHRPLHSWVVGSQMAFDFLRKVYPFLRVKGDEATLAMAFQARIDRRVTGKYRFEGKLSAEEILCRDACRIELTRLKHVIHP